MPIVPGKYRIKNAMAWTCFDEATDGSHIIHGWQQTNQPNQHWLVQRAGRTPNTFSMKNLASGFYARADGTYNDCKIYSSSDFFVWYIEQQQDGSVYIYVPSTNYVADLDNGNAANGTTIHLWEKHPNPEPQQRWYLEQIC